MTKIEKFLTIDLETGKKILKTLEASMVKISIEDGVFTNVESAIKSEIARALEAEGLLDGKITKVIDDFNSADEAIKSLIGDIPESKTVLSLISDLRTEFETYKTNNDARVLAIENDLANYKTTNDAEVALKANKTYVDTELAKKVTTTELITDGKIKTDLLPSIAINETKVVSTVEEAMELVIENGDVVIINPNESITLEESSDEKVILEGTFICVDAVAETFELRFRELYSPSDSISRAEVQNIINKEATLRAEMDDALDKAIKAETLARETADGDLSNRVTTLEGALGDSNGGIINDVQTLKSQMEIVNGDDSVDGSIAKTLVDAKNYTDAELAKETNAELENSLAWKITKEQADRENAIADLNKKVDSLEASEAVLVRYRNGGVAVGDVVSINSNQGTRVFKAYSYIVKDSSDNIVRLSNDVSVRIDGEQTPFEYGYVVGIVVKIDGEDAVVAIMGKIQMDGLEAGKSYYLGTDGRMTTVSPTEVGSQIVMLGRAMTENQFFIRIEEAIEILD